MKKTLEEMTVAELEAKHALLEILVEGSLSLIEELNEKRLLARLELRWNESQVLICEKLIKDKQ